MERPTADGYRVRGWTAEAPQEVLVSYARARRAIFDAPKGGITWNAPEWTPERIRAEEAAYLAADVEQRTVVAVHEATGDVAGLTELIIRPGQPDHGRQLDTAVLNEHRGHGLARAIKAAMMRRLVRERPDIVRISTQTAADNVHMATVNHQIGYRTLWTHYYFEADLEVLKERLRT
ncbi:GNAT family N-acetyltransferase [Streptosporangium subroseum]|uniref:GNAT family N-acetyltransferase n=1 Tax=Streptosporangium subroseum TaxID=106412 RepID=UPI003440E6CB